jgi:hypothetical protein
MRKFLLVRNGTTCAGEFDIAASLRRTDVLDSLTSLSITPIDKLDNEQKMVKSEKRW